LKDVSRGPRHLDEPQDHTRPWIEIGPTPRERAESPRSLRSSSLGIVGRGDFRRAGTSVRGGAKLGPLVARLFGISLGTHGSPVALSALNGARHKFEPLVGGF